VRNRERYDSWGRGSGRGREKETGRIYIYEGIYPPRIYIYIYISFRFPLTFLLHLEQREGVAKQGKVRQPVKGKWKGEGKGNGKDIYI
jgi:hypothetical protein